MTLHLVFIYSIPLAIWILPQYLTFIMINLSQDHWLSLRHAPFIVQPFFLFNSWSPYPVRFSKLTKSLSKDISFFFTERSLLNILNIPFRFGFYGIIFVTMALSQFSERLSHVSLSVYEIRKSIRLVSDMLSKSSRDQTLTSLNPPCSFHLITIFLINI